MSDRECQNCKHARLWTHEEKLAHYKHLIDLNIIPADVDHYICDKIAEGTEWTEDGDTYTYDGYSLDGENYDEVFHCFEERKEEDE